VTRAVRSDNTSVRRVAVIGAGPSGLSAALELAARNIPVDIISRAPAQRSPSVGARDGIAAVLPYAAKGDSTDRHFLDIERAAAGLAVLPLVRAMVEEASSIVGLLDRMAVPFDRTPEGVLQAHASPGAACPRTFAAGSATGQHVVLALDEQLRRFEQELVRDPRGGVIPGEPLVRRLVPWDFVRVVQDDAGVAVGVVVQDLRSMAVAAFPYDSVLLATGGYAGVFVASVGGAPSLGAGLAGVFEQGAVMADAELLFAHPLAIVGPDKSRALPDFIRAESARVFSAKDAADSRDAGTIPERERAYLAALADLENPPLALVAARSIAEARVKSAPVYLDLSHRKADVRLRARLRGVSRMCERFAGKGLFDGPLEIAPAITRTLGGLYIDHETDTAGRLLQSSPRNHATSIPGLYAAGGAASGYHGAAAIAGDLLLADVFGGRLAASGVAAYRAAMMKSAFDLPKSVFDKAQKVAEEEYLALASQNQDVKESEDPHAIFAELCTTMSRDVGLLRDSEGLATAKSSIAELDERFTRAKCADSSSYTNQGGPFMRQLASAIRLAAITTESALSRRDNRRTFVTFNEGAASLTHSFEYACAGKTVTVTDSAAQTERAQNG